MECSKARKCNCVGIVFFLLSLPSSPIALGIGDNTSYVYFSDVNNTSLLMQSFLKLGVQRYVTPNDPKSKRNDWDAIFNETKNVLVWSNAPSRIYEMLIFPNQCNLRFNRLPGSQSLENATLLRQRMRHTLQGDHFLISIATGEYYSSKKVAEQIDRSNSKFDKDRYRDPMFNNRYMVRNVSRNRNKMEPWSMIFDKRDAARLLDNQNAMVDVRHYIEPYLLDGYKFDVGMYVTITSLQPMRIYMYPEAAIRIAKEPYPVILDASAPRNVYDTSEAYTTPWEFPDLIKLNEDMAPLESITSDIPDMWEIVKIYLSLRGLDTSQLEEEMEDAIIHTIVSTESVFIDSLQKLRRKSKMLNDSIQDRSDCLKDSFFEIFRFEFVINRQGSPKLIQIISDPILEASSPEHLEESNYYRVLTEQLLHLLGVHPQAIPTTQSFLNRPHTPDFCAQRCSNTQLAWDTSCYLCPGWFPPHVGYQIYKFAHEYARRGTFQMVYPSMDNHHFQYGNHPMSEYDYAADRYIKSLSRAYSNDMEMMMMVSVPICMIRAHCNHRGDCINGVCACDHGSRGSTCYQIEPTASPLGVELQSNDTRVQAGYEEIVSQSVLVFTMAFMLTLLFLHILYRALRFRMQKHDQKQN